MVVVFAVILVLALTVVTARFRNEEDTGRNANSSGSDVSVQWSTQPYSVAKKDSVNLISSKYQQSKPDL